MSTKTTDHGKFIEYIEANGTRHFHGKGPHCGRIIFDVNGRVRVLCSAMGIIASQQGQGRHRTPIIQHEGGAPAFTLDADRMNQLQCLQSHVMPEDHLDPEALKYLEIFSHLLYPLLRAAIAGESEPFQRMADTIQKISNIRSGEATMDGIVNHETARRVAEVIQSLAQDAGHPPTAAQVKNRLDKEDKKHRPSNLRRHMENWRHVLKALGFNWLPRKKFPALTDC